MHVRKKSLKEDIAVIKGDRIYLFFVIIEINICAVDGLENRLLTRNKAEVKPGFHRLAVKYNLFSYSVKISANFDLLINVEAGHEYKISEKGSCIDVIDTTSGTLVTRSPLNQYNIFSLYSI